MPRSFAAVMRKYLSARGPRRRAARGSRASSAPAARAPRSSPRRPRSSTSRPSALSWSQRRFGSAEVMRKVVLVEPRDGAVVEHLAGAVAPGRVEHLADLRTRDVARHDAVEQARRVLARAPGTCRAARCRAAPPRSGSRGTRARGRARTSSRRRTRPSAARRGSRTAAAVRAWNGVVFSIPCSGHRPMTEPADCRRRAPSPQAASGAGAPLGLRVDAGQRLDSR